MAVAPAFTATPKVWAKAVSATADGTPASHTPTGGTTTLVTGTANGYKIEEIAVVSKDTANDAGVISLWLHDGTTYFIYDDFKILGTDAATTAPGERYVRSYGILLVPTGWTLQISSSVASQLIDVIAIGGEY